MTALNGCQLVRVFVREAIVGSSITDDTIKDNRPFEVVAQVEVGEAVFADGGPYRFAGVVTDLHEPEVLVADLSLKGTLQDSTWDTLAKEIVIASVPAQGVTRDAHMYQVMLVLAVGKIDPIVTFSESDLFVITRS